MRKSDAEFHLRDVRQMSDRVMIDLFKRKIHDMKNLLKLYRAAIKEVEQSPG
jgi:hypothetical protein